MSYIQKYVAQTNGGGSMRAKLESTGSVPQHGVCKTHTLYNTKVQDSVPPRESVGRIACIAESPPSTESANCRSVCFQSNNDETNPKQHPV